MMQENIIAARRWIVEQKEPGYWEKFFAWRANFNGNANCVKVEFPRESERVIIAFHPMTMSGCI